MLRRPWSWIHQRLRLRHYWLHLGVSPRQHAWPHLALAAVMIAGVSCHAGADPPTVSPPVGLGTASQGGSFYAHFKPSVEPIPLNESFAVDLWLFEDAECTHPIAGADLTLDCRMPAHRHGMLREVEWSDLGGGHYQVQGVLCHMIGHWVFHIDLRRGALTERAQFDLYIE